MNHQSLTVGCQMWEMQACEKHCDVVLLWLYRLIQKSCKGSKGHEHWSDEQRSSFEITFRFDGTNL